jgi:hypothetical protein
VFSFVSALQDGVDPAPLAPLLPDAVLRIP